MNYLIYLIFFVIESLTYMNINNSGNLSIPITDLTNFPFISEEYYKKFKYSYGMDVSIVLRNTTPIKTFIYLSEYQFVLKK